MDHFLTPSPTALDELFPYSLETSHKRTLKGSQDGSEPDQDSQDTKAKKPRAKPGRKLDTSTPTDKRVAQSREAQRQFRERKANQLKDLESKVSELTAIVENRGPTPQEIQLQQKVEALEQEVQVLRQMTFSFSMPYNLNQPIDNLLTNNKLFETKPPHSRLTPSPTSTLNTLATQQASLTADDLFADLLLQSLPAPALFSPPPHQQPTTASPLTSISSNSFASTAPVSLTPQLPLDFTSLVDFTSFRDSPAPLTGINGLDDTDQDFLSALLKINSPNSTAEVTASTSLMTPPMSSSVQTPPKSKQEAEEKACQDMPHLIAAYDSLKSIPSLAKDESLLDELCDAFVACSTKCERAVIENNGVCPGDNLQGPEKEAMKIVQSKMLAQCSGEDQVRFLEVMEEVKEKNKEHIKKKVAVAVLLGGEGIRGGSL
ncbi:hypothetical protein HDU98_012280 [Podochytrium sp. JEL0797]|nr:hypothetical protein HDU98_012280 [Podochytrium sp. JEL0797]